MPSTSPLRQTIASFSQKRPKNVSGIPGLSIITSDSFLLGDGMRVYPAGISQHRSGPPVLVLSPARKNRVSLAEIRQCEFAVLEREPSLTELRELMPEARGNVRAVERLMLFPKKDEKWDVTICQATGDVELIVMTYA